jgi:hypothetical protein
MDHLFLTSDYLETRLILGIPDHDKFLTLSHLRVTVFLEFIKGKNLEGLSLLRSELSIRDNGFGLALKIIGKKFLHIAGWVTDF